MAGTTPMAPYVKLDSTSMLGTTYKTTIDGNSVSALRIVGKFLPHAQTSPNMTVVVDSGHIFDGATLTEVAAQTTSTFSAPTAHPRIDRIVVDNTSGVIAVVAGTEAVSPVAPAIPAGKSPVAQIALTTSTTAITNIQITDERDFSAANAGGFGQQNTISSSATCDLGTVTSHNAIISGTSTISSFGSSASVLQPIYMIEFSGVLTLSYDITAMVLPGGTDIDTAPGDTAIAEYLGAGNWRIRQFSPATPPVPKSPTKQYLKTAGSGTYNTPSGCTKIEGRMIAAGAGGGARSTNAGSAGGNSAFDTITAVGGTGGSISSTSNSQGGVGGSGGSGASDLRVAGMNGLLVLDAPGAGGSGPWGGAGSGTSTSGGSATGPGSGGSGGGAPNTNNAFGPSGGGAGEYVEFTIINPASTYSFTIGAGGAGGAAGTFAGGNGADGIIVLTEFYG